MLRRLHPASSQLIFSAATVRTGTRPERFGGRGFSRRHKRTARRFRGSDNFRTTAARIAGTFRGFTSVEWRRQRDVGGGPVVAPGGKSGAIGNQHLALQGDALGAVQVRAHVSGDQVGATITVERHDVHAVLTSDLPALHQALNERQLRLENVSLQQSSLPTGTGVGDSAGRQHQQGGAPSRTVSSGGTASQFLGTAENAYLSEAPESRTVFDSNGRLSVRA